ncbi:hypothetical protein JXA85_07955 [Candidatus Woesearchaeota archaeon]|nr:hypothetical protein [Candidatus Woesearchaeota archaeon]
MDRFKYHNESPATKGGLKAIVVSLVVLATIVISFTLIGFFQEKPTSEKRGSTVALTIETIGKTTTEEYRIAEIKVGNLIRINHSLETNSFGFIRCIDGICSDNNYWWNISVSGKPLLSSADYKVTQGNNVFIGLQKK